MKIGFLSSLANIYRPLNMSMYISYLKVEARRDEHFPTAGIAELLPKYNSCNAAFCS